MVVGPLPEPHHRLHERGRAGVRRCCLGTVEILPHDRLVQLVPPRPAAAAAPSDIPRAQVSSGDGMCGEVGGPGGVFLVAGAVAETAVEDADEAVAEGPEGLVVGGAAGALPVVGGAGPG